MPLDKEVRLWRVDGKAEETYVTKTISETNAIENRLASIASAFPSNASQVETLGFGFTSSSPSGSGVLVFNVSGTVYTASTVKMSAKTAAT